MKIKLSEKERQEISGFLGLPDSKPETLANFIGYILSCALCLIGIYFIVQACIGLA